MKYGKSTLKEKEIEKSLLLRKEICKIKGTLYSYNSKIKISIKPYKEYLMFNVSKA